MLAYTANLDARNMDGSQALTTKQRTYRAQMKIAANGFLTGMLLQLAIGPVFFYIVHLTLERTLLDGLVAVLAVTLVDYLYITLAILGIGKALERKRVKRVFGVVSSIVLIVFGVMIIRDAAGSALSLEMQENSTSLFTSFASVFLLTISSPLTIVFFTSLFAAKAVEYNYTMRELTIFGLTTGSATFTFLGASVLVISALGAAIPLSLIRWMNIIVGVILVGYGAVRLVKAVADRGDRIQEGIA